MQHQESKEINVLIVDDIPFNISALKAILSNFDFFIDSAYNGKEALEKIKAKKY